MAAQKSPLSGYNHNLKYRNRVYHVQTEDSGLDNPHIFTHLFHDGTILNTLKSEYADLVAAPDWEDQLRARMQNQHKDMMKGLIKGSFDDKIVSFFGDLEPAEAEELPMATLPPPPKRDRKRAAGEATPPPEPPAQAPTARPPSQAPWQPPTPVQQQGQRAAADSAGVVVAMPMVIVGQQGQQVEAQPAPPPAASQATAGQPPAGQPPVVSVSPQPSVFEAHPEQAKNVPDSIFGSELISEKSLDEVILAYLSEDMTEE